MRKGLKINLNRKTEKLIGFFIIFILIALSLIFILPKLINTNKQIERLQEAINTDDIDYLLDKVEMANGDSFSKKELKSLLKIIKKQDSFNVLDYIEMPEFRKLENTVYPIKLVESGKHLLIYPDYKLIFKDYSLNFNLLEPLDDFKLIINGKEIPNDKLIIDEYSIIYPNIKPGIYKYKLKFGDDFKEHIEDKIEVLNIENSLDYNSSEDYKEVNTYGLPINVECNIQGKYFYIKTDLPTTEHKAKLYVNGKKTDVKLENNEFILGPVYSEEPFEVYSEVKIDNKKYKTNKVKVDPLNSDYYELEFPVYLNLILSEELEDLVDQTMYNYNYGLVSAISFNEPEQVTDTMITGSPIYEKQLKLISDLYNKGISERLDDYEILNIKEVDDETLKVTVYEHHTIFDDNYESKPAENKWVYTLKLDKKIKEYNDYVFKLYDIEKAK